MSVNFSGFWYMVWVDSIQAFDSNGAIYTLDADSWNHNNGVLKSESTDSSFILTVDGEFSSNGAHLLAHRLVVEASVPYQTAHFHGAHQLISLMEAILVQKPVISITAEHMRILLFMTRLALNMIRTQCLEQAFPNRHVD